MTYSELELAYMLVSAKGTGLQVNAYVKRSNGEIFVDNEALNEGEAVPDNLDDDLLYARIPAQDELLDELELMVLFVERYLNGDEQVGFESALFDVESAPTVEKIRAGAQYLEKVGKLAAWRKLITATQDRALRNWAEREGISVA